MKIKIIDNITKGEFQNVILISVMAVIFLIFSVMIIGLTFSKIYQRHNSEPYLSHLYVHDSAIQLEEAIKFILKGKNPYTENYFGTPLENWYYAEGPINPALYHFIYLPFHLLFSIPFFLISNFFINWFDERFVYVIIFLLTILLILKWPNKSLQAKLIFLVIFLVSPFFYLFFIEGRSDIFVFFWLILSIYFLRLNQINYSSLTLAFAVTIKQSSWFILPFYFAYLYYRQRNKLNFFQKIKNIVNKTQLFFITIGLIIIPFLFWDFGSFIDDTIKYAAGASSIGNYPIQGIGFQQVVLKLVNSPFDYWPFWIPELIFTLPLLFILLKLQKINNSLGQTVFNYSLLLLTFWFFSRFFNDNYIGFIIILLAFAIFITEKKQITPKSVDY